MPRSDIIELERATSASEAALERRRALYLSELDWPKPVDAAPPAPAPLEVRDGWSVRFLPWFFSQTGGEHEHPDGGTAGHRWRAEYPECLSDPQAFEKYAEREIAAYQAKGGE